MRGSVIRLRILLAGVVAGLAMAGTVCAAAPRISAKLEPAEISLGEAARLTITAYGDEAPAISPPVVPGLEFSPVSQSRRVESINGVTDSTFSITYEVVAREAGTYVIASIAKGMQPLSLRVTGSGDAAAQSGAAGASVPPPVPSVGPTAATTHVSADGAAFVRLVVPKHELYVGENVPVEIQVGTRDGVVASLNGTPTLNGDAFTLDKLSAEPERRTPEVIDGKPFTVFTWHGVLAAVKPGALSLTMETPLTVRMQSEHPGAQFTDDTQLADLFNDPAFQGFFGGGTERDITVSSPPASFSVLELQLHGRPPDFSGAVGQFKISSELSERQVTAGDPVTLRMTVSGEGNFDRVASSMLTDVEHWKTYQPTPRFTTADGTSNRGEKTFEQPLVAMQPGKQSLPPLRFSYFDPVNRRYETAHTEPIALDVVPAATFAAAPQTNPSAPPATPLPSDSGGITGLRPDHMPERGYVNSLVPVYYEPRYLAVPALALLAFPAAWFWRCRRERRASEGVAGMGARSLEPARVASDLNRATSSGNVQEFFQAARTVLQNALGARWQVPPETVTLAEIDTRLGADSEVRRVFALADEAIYAGRPFALSELEDWKRIVLRQLQPRSVSE